MQGLEGYDPIALIIDDTSRVWPDHTRNLLAVERYLWFPVARRQFRLTGPSLMEQRRRGRWAPTLLPSWAGHW